jgi:[acyl-carrier-protein] S-malonyltransferase
MMDIGEAPRMKTAFLFPGQGSQQVGMGRALFETAPAARAIFEQADSALELSLSRLCFEGPEDELRLTANTQPAILAASIAALRALEARGARADFVAGHSLGEYSALVAAGSMKFEDAIKAVRRRGEFMQEAVPAGEGAMAALIGLPIEAVKSLCEEASSLGVCAPANINSPNQTVIAGNKAAIERAVELAKAKGAKRAVMLTVSAPFHCQLMKPAAERMTTVLNEIDFKDLSVPLVTNVDATLITSGRDARDSLLRQVVSPVRWSESVQVLINKGVGRFVEIGPGRVLSGLVRQISRDCLLSNVEDPQSLDAAAASLEL